MFAPVRRPRRAFLERWTAQGFQVQAYESELWEDFLMIMITRRDALAFGASLSALGLAASPALAQQRFFRIGTGGTGGTYYPVGGMIANAISTPTINVSVKRRSPAATPISTTVAELTTA